MKNIKSFIAISLCIALIVLVGCTASNNSASVSAYDANSANYTMSIDAGNQVHSISDMLYGIFFEDINFSCDGGLYAEMVANRSFEFTELAKDDQMYRWSAVDSKASVAINADDALNENNTNYLKLCFDDAKTAGVENSGFLDGMAVEKGKCYKLSFYAKSIDGYIGGVNARIIANNKVVAKASVDAVTSDWTKYELTLKTSKTANENVRLQLFIDGNAQGGIALDMVSLFPEDTYNNRDNGLRNDLATMLEELSPKFLRFPGGCVIEGYDASTAYSWKDSVGVGSNGLPLEFNGKYGDVAARKQGINIWTDINATDDEWPSFMSYGLGFYEYFQFAEDIGAVGVPVLNCGLYCQPRAGEALPIDSPMFKQYVQDMLDLVEFCRGESNTVWGKLRADMGHPNKFELKYICIGNENWGKAYYDRYQKFLEAFNKAKDANPNMYEGIELIYSSGTDDGLSGNPDYLKSYEYAKKNIKSDSASEFAGAVDQHYYNDPEWFYKNADYYDETNYKRTTSEMTDTSYGGAINVFLGEYASWSNTMNSALSEGAYMTGLERNGDIVRMTTYAPLFSSTVARHWAPNLIWFNNNSCVGSTSYYMQKLFANNAGSMLLSSTLNGANIADRATTGKVGIGTWNTTATFDNAVIIDNKTGDVLSQDDFESDTSSLWEQVADGDFAIANGVITQNSLEPVTTDLGSVMYYGDANWSNYTYTVEATKLAGDEGFIIPFAVDNSDNCYFWNIGGYGNTVSCLQRIHNGIKSGQLEGTTRDFVAENNKTYKLKIVVDNNNFKCYIDDELYVDYDAVTPAYADAYQVVSTDSTGDIIIKLVNATDMEKSFAVNIDNATSINSVAKAYQLAGNSFKDENILGQELACDIKEFDLNGVSDKFNFTAPKCSATVIRISTK